MKHGVLAGLLALTFSLGVGFAVNSLVREQEAPRYARLEWRHWIDADGDCQDTRTEVLLRDAVPGTVKLDAAGCRVLAGRWVDPYSGLELSSPQLLDVDHLVPLENAHRSGGWRWTSTAKRDYANALDYRWHLVAVSATENRKKGSKGPEAYQPPDSRFHCHYAQAWASVKFSWGLEPQPGERAALRRMLEACP